MRARTLYHDYSCQVTLRNSTGNSHMKFSSGILGVAVGVMVCLQCAPGDSPHSVRPQDVRDQLSVLAADSMEGRRTATPGAVRAASFLARQFESFGTLPAGDSGYYQRVPMTSHVRSNGRAGLVLLSSLADLDTVPPERRVLGVNVIGIVQGADADVGDEAVVVGAHFDHVGIGQPVDGDSIYNGADDDASGVVAVLEIARALASGPKPRRTVIFLLSTGEEMGLLGTRWYLEHPIVPLERTVADLQIEMIARPDSQAGGSGRGWLTGYERSTMGDMLRDAGNPIVPDPHPEQGFFERSDNIAFAYRGIPAHTLSSYGLHADYHRPSDEIDGVDFAHMTLIIEAAIDAVRLIADGEAPSWHPGGRPLRRR